MQNKLLLAVTVLLSACGGGGGGDSEDNRQPFGLTARVAVSGLTFPDTGAQDGEVRVQRAYPNLSFTAPLAVVQAPGDRSRRFVATRSSCSTTPMRPPRSGCSST